jgi:hypothetical protein
MKVICVHLVIKDIVKLLESLKNVKMEDIAIWVKDEEQYYKFLKYFGHNIDIHIGTSSQMLTYYNQKRLPTRTRTNMFVIYPK